MVCPNAKETARRVSLTRPAEHTDMKTTVTFSKTYDISAALAARLRAGLLAVSIKPPDAPLRFIGYAVDAAQADRLILAYHHATGFAGYVLTHRVACHVREVAA